MGRVTKFEYDYQGRPALEKWFADSSAVTPSNTIQSNYFAASNPQSISGTTNGGFSSATYLIDGRLDRVGRFANSTATGTPAVVSNYSYNDLNLLSGVNHASGGSASY